MALYTVTVTNVTRGWAYTATEGVAPNPADPVQLAQPLSYSWAFEDQLVPHACMVPLQLGLRLLCHGAGDVPLCDRGDELRVDLRLGTVGARLVQSPALYVTTVEVTTDLPTGVVPNDAYTTLVEVRASDDTAELPSKRPQPRAQIPSGVPFNQKRFRRFITEVGQQIARSIGVPSWWATEPTPQTVVGSMQNPGGTAGGGGHVWSEDAKVLLESALNTWQPGWQNHTLVPAIGAAYPAGYGTSFVADIVGDPVTGLADPNTARRLLVVPAARRTTNQAWPLVFAVRSGVLTLQPTAAPAGVTAHDPIGVDAAWCDLPVKARRAREHVVNAVSVRGVQRKVTPPGPVITEVPGERTTLGAAPLGEPAALRTVPSYVYLGDSADSDYSGGGAPQADTSATRALTFLSDDSQRSAWVFDAFTVQASRVPADLQPVVLPRLAPRIPGEADGDGHVLKHLTVYRVDPHARFNDAPAPVTGFVVSGNVTVANGEVSYTLTLTPGLPIPMTGAYVQTDLATPVTVAQVDGGTYQAQLCNTIDPLIRVVDLAYVGA